MIKLVELPFCSVVMLDEWNASPSRYFAAYRCRGAYRSMLGHPVVDEFATISAPIFLAPRSLLGKIYNAGISLGHKRDPEMGIDLGWPPLCLGLDEPAPELPSDWEARLLEAVQTNGDAVPRLRRKDRDGHEVETLQIGGATIVATSAPLLPKQLSHLCEAASNSVVVTVSLGNRLERVRGGTLRTVDALSQDKLSSLYSAVEELLR